MQFKFKAAAAVAALSALTSFAAPVGPIAVSYETFGNLSGATYGGSGIPTDPSAIRNVQPVTGGPATTIGLIAHQRYDSPALTNNGAGVYYAQPGVDSHAPSPANPYALWNVGFYTSNTTAFTYKLFYDFDPAAGTDEAAHGTVTFGGGQDSWNLGMDFLDTDIAGIIAQPSFASFDPNAVGEYTFALVAYSGDVEAGRVAIAVQVGATAVPEPSSIALLGLGLLGAVTITRRRRKTS